MAQSLNLAQGIAVDSNKNLNVKGSIALPDGSTITSVPKVTGIIPDDNTYTTLGAYAVDVAGGYVTINGSGFQNGATVIIGSLQAISVAFVSASQLNVAVPSQPAGTYTVYVVNPDSSVAIRVNGLQYSSLPVWTGASTLASDASAVSLQLNATSDSTVTYSLQSGSSLPSGLSLSSSGLLSGSVNSINLDTTYNFTVVATDVELQKTPRTFSVTLTLADPYFRYTTLLIHGDGTNGANNSTFADSSSNNITLTPTGTPAQGSFSPFSKTGWSIYGQRSSSSGLYVSGNNVFNFTNADFTCEAWVFLNSLPATDDWPGNWSGNYVVMGTGTPSAGDGLDLIIGQTQMFVQSNDTKYGTASHGMSVGVWYHLAWVRISGTLYLYVNGVQKGSVSFNTNVGTGSNTYIGNETGEGAFFDGYISNIRVIKNQGISTQEPLHLARSH